jgi:hypothetical protein
VKRQLIDSVARGIKCDLAPGEEINEALMKKWGPSNTVSASLIRDVLRGRHVEHPDPHGVRLRGAKIAGRLDLEGMTTGVPLTLTGCYLPEGADVRGAHLPALRLMQCLAENPLMSPLDAERLNTQDLDLTGLKVIAKSKKGAVILTGAHVGGQLVASGATLTNSTGTALFAERLHVDGSMLLTNRFSATGSGEAGAVRLVAAHVGGHLDASGATLSNDTGPALAAFHLHVDVSMVLTDRFSATGSGEAGAVRLIAAHVGAQLVASGATLTNLTGPALFADAIQIDTGLFLNKGFTATGSGEAGAVRLVAAHVGGALKLNEATLVNETGPALFADRLQVDADLFLQEELKVTAGGDKGAVRLEGAHIGGRIGLDVAAIKDPQDGPGKLALDGLVYRGLPEQPPADEWLDILRDRTIKYSPQPYRQLAAASQAAGEDTLTRKILMAQRQQQLAQPKTTQIQRAWGKLTHVTLGYGYQPWRALIGLLVVVILSVFLNLFGGAQGGLVEIKASGSPGTPCSVLERVGVGLNFALPVVKTPLEGTCAATVTAVGNAISIGGWVLQLLAWSLATLFVAGFTGAVRKT